jgi:peptide/nickel transport system substrate-binding protein
MKPNLRLQIVLAVACLGFILALMTVQVSTANLCTVEVPASGGYLVEGVVGRPQRINPILAADNQLDSDLVSLVFDGLTRYDAQGVLEPALADSWEISDDGLTVTFTLGDHRWHDGEPVTAADAAFTYGLLQDEALARRSSFGALWQAVEMTVLDERQIAFTLPTRYPPFLEATTQGLLPAHLLDGVGAAELLAHAFNQFPVGTGPFMVESGAWQRTGRLRLLPNPRVWQGGTNLEGLELRFYPDAAAAVAAYRAGEISAIHRVGPDVIDLLAQTPEVRLFSAPGSRMTQALFNLTETGHPALDDDVVRDALDRGLDRGRLIDEALAGQGLLLSGPYLPSSSAFRPDLLTYRPADVEAAAIALTDAGWVLEEGDAVRRQGEVELLLRLVFAEGQETTALALQRQWAAIGVGVSLQAVPVAELDGALRDRVFDVALLEIAPLGDPDLYDLWSQEAIVRGHNFSGWNSRRASEALEAARQTWDAAERQAWYDRFIILYDQALPAITLYQHVNTFAISPAVRTLPDQRPADIGRADTLRERYEGFSGWFLLYRDVLVACPDGAEDENS